MSEVGRTRDAGFQIGVRRTLPHPPATVWAALTSDAGLAAWLGSPVEVEGGAGLERGAAIRTSAGAEGEIRSVHPVDRIRARLHPPGRHAATTIQIALVPASTGTTLVLHEEHLADAVEREARREHWRGIADELAAAVDRHASGAH
jgi:uncharacterized protein YndB with AHSA1/START domain